MCLSRREFTWRGRRMVAVWVACLIAGAFGAPAIAMAQDDKETAKKEIQAVLDQSTKSLTSKDYEAYGKNLTSDYRRTDYFGDTMDREKSLADLKSQVDAAQGIESTSTIEALNVKGDEATVLVRTKGKATTKLEDKDTPLTWDQRDVQIWTRTADGWRLKESMGLTQSMMVNDKPYTPKLTDEEAAARTAIQSVYNALVRAVVEGDSESFGKLIPADFTVYPIQTGAAQNREQFLASMKDQLSHKGGVADFKLENAVVKGDTAIVLGTLRFEQPQGNGNDTQKTTAVMWERDVWKKTDKGWVPVEFHPLFREQTVGGKVQPAIFATPGRKS